MPETRTTVYVRMRQSYFGPMPPAAAMAGAEQGWSEQLDKLERLLAN